MASNSDIGRQWRQDVLSTLDWSKAPNQAGVSPGEAGGYFVEAPGFPRRAYLKPAAAHGDAKQRCRAAREKIASDLAFDLGVLVPPVQLRVLDAVPAGHEAAVAISLVMFPVQWPWSYVKGRSIDATPEGAALAKVIGAASCVVAFDTWIAQTDHGDHPSNIVWGYEPDDLANSEIVFLDFAFSMGSDGSWRNDSWKTIARAPFPALMLKHKNALQTDEIVSKIEQLAPSIIEEVVNRVPDTHLDAAQKQIIVTGLIERRSLLRKCLKDDGLLP